MCKDKKFCIQNVLGVLSILTPVFLQLENFENMLQFLNDYFGYIVSAVIFIALIVSNINYRHKQIKRSIAQLQDDIILKIEVNELAQKRYLKRELSLLKEEQEKGLSLLKEKQEKGLSLHKEEQEQQTLLSEKQLQEVKDYALQLMRDLKEDIINGNLLVKK